MLEKITKAGLCHGCGGCVAAVPHGKITMAMTEHGYLRPEVVKLLTAQDEATIKQICSGYTLGHQGLEVRSDVIWGEILALRYGYASSNEVRYKGSSGGVLSAIAIYLLDNRLVDFVLQVRADPNDPFGNVALPSRTRADVIAAAGSRYVPSSPLKELSRYLESGEKFAVIGKPCDIATLRKMARVDRRIDAQITLMMSFMCAGLPSRHGAIETAKAMGAEPKDVESFAFRGDGWPGYSRAKLRDGRELRMSYDISWGTILNRHLQFRCKICPDGIGEFADITCADAWYLVDGKPNFDERSGRSLIISRTRRGETLLQDVLRAKAIVAAPAKVEEIPLFQPYQAVRRSEIVARLVGMFLAGARTPRYSGLNLTVSTLRLGPIHWLRTVWGTFKRAVKSGRRN